MTSMAFHLLKQSISSRGYCVAIHKCHWANTDSMLHMDTKCYKKYLCMRRFIALMCKCSTDWAYPTS